MPDGSPQKDLRREVAELKSLVQDQREEINQLKQTGAANLAESLGLDTPHGRRQAMKYVAGGATLPALLAYASSEGAMADAAGADLGTQADPWDKLWAHAIGAGDGADVLNVDDAIVHENEAVNSATTIGNVTWVYYDSALGSFTITIPASLESKGVVLRFIDETGNAGTNSVDVTSTNWNIAGSGSVTLDADDHVYEIFGDGGAWLDQRFIPTVEAGSIAIGEAVINNLGGKAIKNSTQSIPNNSVTQIELDVADFEDDATNIVDVDLANNQLVAKKGGVKYDMKAGFEFGIGMGDGTRVLFQLAINGSANTVSDRTQGGDNRCGDIVTDVSELSANDTITISIFQDSGSSKDLSGSAKTKLAATVEG